MGGGMKMKMIKTIQLFFVLSLFTFGPLLVIGSSDGNEREDEGQDHEIVLMQDQGHFVENMGQWPDEVVLAADTGSAIMAMTISGFILDIGDHSGSGHVIGFHFDLERSVPPTGSKEAGHKTNFIKGNDPEKWVFGASSYSEIIYHDAWDGIDARYYFTSDGTKYDMIMEPGSDPEDIMIEVEGQDSLDIVDDDLVIRLDRNRYMRDTGIVAFYEDDPEETIPVEFVLKGYRSYGFELGEYDRSRTVIIDPLLEYSTYYGGGGVDDNPRMIQDETGDLYIACSTWSYDIQTTPGAYQNESSTWSDLLVLKMDHDLSSLDFVTYFGGDNEDEVGSIDIDESGDIYVSGYTQSTDLPTSENAFQRNITHGDKLNRTWELFVFKMNSSGDSLNYSTYIGSNGSDDHPDIKVDPSGRAIVVASTQCDDFPTTSGAYDNSFNGGKRDIVLFVLDGNGTSLDYSTYIGGSRTDIPNDMELVDGRTVYITGTSNSTDLPISNGAYDNSYDHHDLDINVFVMAFNLSSGDLEVSTYMSIGDGKGIAVDDDLNIYVTGNTICWNFTTTEGSFQPDKGLKTDAFVFKMDPTGSNLIYSTYLGGDLYESGNDIDVNSTGCAFITGYTSSVDYPVTRGSYSMTSGGSSDGYLTTIEPDGSDLIYSTYIGGSNVDMLDAIEVRDENKAIVSGWSYSTSYPVTSGCYQRLKGGVDDLVISVMDCNRIYLVPDPPVNITGSMKNGTVELDWKVPPRDGGLPVLGYNISRKTKYTDYTRIGSTSSLTYVDDQIDVRQTYYYRITSHNSLGTSDDSEEVKVFERDPPIFIEDITPSEGHPGKAVNFKTRVSDNSVIDDVNVLLRIDGGSVKNISMKQLDTDLFSYSLKIEDREQDIDYSMIAIDIKGNSNITAWKEIPVRGENLPVFLEDLTPEEVDAYSSIVFSVDVIDNIEVDFVKVEYWSGDGYHKNRTLAPEDNRYSLVTHATSLPGEHVNYRFIACDINDNWNITDIKTVKVSDISSPVLLDDLTPSQATTGDPFSFRVGVMDAIGVDSVRLSIQHSNGSSSEMMMENMDGYVWEHTITAPDDLEVISYNFILEDISGNARTTDPRSVEVVDNDPPIFVDDTSDASGSTGSLFNFICIAEDNIGVKDVLVHYSTPTDQETTQRMKDENGTFSEEIMIPVDMTGWLRYRFSVIDMAGNRIEVPSVNVLVSDSIDPTMEPVEPIRTYVGEIVHIEIEVTDNIGIERILWSGSGLDHSGDEWTGSFDMDGLVVITIEAFDGSNNSVRIDVEIEVLPIDLDSDLDLIPDLVEIENGLSPYDPLDANEDMDMDGLSNLEEYMIGTSIVRSDSDNDGMPDGWEYQLGMDPLDPTNGDADGDGRTDLEEYISGTDPNVPESTEEISEEEIPGFINIVLVVFLLISIMVLILLIARRKKYH